jgi:hypothetical protein
MIDVFHADDDLQRQIQNVDNERELIKVVMQKLHHYSLATRVKHSEIDIAFAATGGPSQWVNVDKMTIEFEPVPIRQTLYGDILVEQSVGYVNLSTPAGFIPLVDAVESLGSLKKKQLS